MIVTLEGIDASGKATQSKRLVKRLKESGVKSERFDFPRYGSYSGQALLMLLKREWFAARRPKRREDELIINPDADIDVSQVEWTHDPRSSTSSVQMPAEYVQLATGGRRAPVEDEAFTALTIQALMTINRYEHLDILREWESDGKAADKGVLVLDRYYGSGIAYGDADGLDGTFLRRIHAGLPPSNLWVLVDIPPEESVKRRPDRRDEYEKRAGFMQMVRQRFLELFKNPNLPGEWQVIDGMGTEDEVHGRIWDAYCAERG